MALDEKELEEFDFEHASGSGNITFDNSFIWNYEELDFHLRNLKGKEIIIHCKPEGENKPEGRNFRYSILYKKRVNLISQNFLF